MNRVFKVSNFPHSGKLNPWTVKKHLNQTIASDLVLEETRQKIEDTELEIIECGRDEKTMYTLLESLHEITNTAIAREQPIFFENNNSLSGPAHH
jgi:hypothetical protein